MANAAAGVSGLHETAAVVPLLSDMRRQIESTIPRGGMARPFADGPSVLALPAEVWASVGSDARSCRRLAISFTWRPSCPGAPQEQKRLRLPRRGASLSARTNSRKSVRRLPVPYLKAFLEKLSIPEIAANRRILMRSGKEAMLHSVYTLPQNAIRSR